MTSAFTWLDYSEAERRKMLDVIDLFGEKTTRDELGLGGVRDAFADLLFPGTTTIQTRAKYFLFVPWMYLDLERKKVTSSKIRGRARDFEIWLAKKLGDADGVIGKVAKESLKRLPSSVYWQGLSAWGIRRYPNSQSEYHRSLDLFYARHKGHAAGAAEFDGEGAHEHGLANWHTGIVKPGSGFPDQPTMDLSFEEASYLRERVMTKCDDSMLAYLLKHHINAVEAQFAWEVPGQFPEMVSRPLTHARNFSETIHGAQLLYNLILADQTENVTRINEYRKKLNKWWQKIEQRRGELLAWNQTEFWLTVQKVNPRVGGKAKTFIQSWIDLAINAGSQGEVVDTVNSRKLIELREFQIKGSLARTRNQRARELWGGAAGSDQLDLRWRTSRRLIDDILQGIEVNADA